MGPEGRERLGKRSGWLTGRQVVARGAALVGKNLQLREPVSVMRRASEELAKREGSGKVEPLEVDMVADTVECSGALLGNRFHAAIF